jgi:hypothetical protein
MPLFQNLRTELAVFVRDYVSLHTIIPLIIIAVLIYLVLPERQIHQFSGILVSQEPIQNNLDRMPSFSFKGFSITPLASYDITARVLAKEIYRTGHESGLVPVDLLLGWQQMSDTSLLKHFTFHLSGRYYTSQVDSNVPMSKINAQLANNHLIPAARAIEHRLKNARVGQILRLQGYLVRVDGANGYSWTSSLSRTDEGWGACELVFVEHAEEVLQH